MRAAVDNDLRQTGKTPLELENPSSVLTDFKLRVAQQVTLAAWSSSGMSRPDDHSPASSEGDRPSVTNEVGDGSGSVPTDPDDQRFVQKTLSESGMEG